MHDPHAHHRAPGEPSEKRLDNDESHAPAEPGYPHHPELAEPEMNEQAGHAAGHQSAHHGDHAGADAHAGHDKHAGHSVAMFRDKFWISLLLTLPTIVWGHMLQSALGYTAPAFPGSRWIPAALGTAVFIYGGWVFIQGAVRELKDRLPGMMTLISLAITVAFVFSAVVTLGLPGYATLGGAGDACHDHAARSLDRDAFDLPG